MLTGWQWIDGYCYYFSTESVEQGAMYAGRKTPDGYLTNENGQWTQGRIVMQRTDAGFTTQDTAKNTTKTNTGGRESDSDSDGGSGSGGSSSGEAINRTNRVNPGLQTSRIIPKLQTNRTNQTNQRLQTSRIILIPRRSINMCS